MSMAKRVVGRLGSPVMGRLLSGRAISVLCYHRVVDDVGAGMFPELKSASPERFEAHLDLIGDSHDFIDEAALVEWLAGRGSLPDRPVLLTFDDGYLDNYEVVYPILRRRGIPATFFLATQHMDERTLLWWDLASVVFHRSAVEEGDLPILGYRRLADESAAVSREWIEAAKKVSDRDRRVALESLSECLGVGDTSPEKSVSMSWDQAREMADNGMSIGGHTHSHPILSRMDDRASMADIATGLERIREELGHGVSTFAYPNGGAGDFGSREKEAADELGVRVAFTLSSGPATRDEVEQDALAVRRIYVGDGDDLDTLELKLMGAGRLLDRVRG